MATHSGILAWRIPMNRGTWRATVHGVTKSLKKKKINKPIKTKKKMVRSSKQTFLQRRHRHGQETHKKTFNIINYWKNANQNYNKVSPHIAQNDYHLTIYEQ